VPLPSTIVMGGMSLYNCGVYNMHDGLRPAFSGKCRYCGRAPVTITACRYCGQLVCARCVTEPNSNRLNAFTTCLSCTRRCDVCAWYCAADACSFCSSCEKYLCTACVPAFHMRLVYGTSMCPDCGCEGELRGIFVPSLSVLMS